VTPNSLARTAFLLFGVYLIVGAFVSTGHSLTQSPLIWQTGDETTSLLAQAGFSLAARITAAVMFSLIPGIVLLVKGVAWADRLMPPEAGAPTEVGFLALLAVGLVLLGAQFVVGGFAGLFGALIGLLNEPEILRGNAWQNVASSSAYFVGGLILIVVGLRAARSAA
jgi:hypothetical protein